MTRTITSRLFAACLLWALLSPLGMTVNPQAAGAAEPLEDVAAKLAQIMLLPEMLKVMQAEGQEYGATLQKEFLDGGGGQAWRDEVGAIYAPERLLPLLQNELADDFRASEATTAPILEFFSSPFGQRIVTLELAARRALLEDAIEQASRQKVEDMRLNDGARLGLLQDYITANHLVDLNVASALNANMAFFRGLAESGVFEGELSEDEMLAQVWSQEDEVRAETESWLLSFGAVAYAPLSDEELRAYTQFSMTPEGVALNRALFAAFDAIFLKVSHDLGLAVGRRTVGTDL